MGRLLTRGIPFGGGGRVEPPIPLLSFPRPVFGNGVITGVAQDELGIQYVVRLRVVERRR